MSARFEELDWQQTPMGEITLRRRLEPTLKVDVYEVLLGEEFLMSSLFTVAEEELARLALARLTGTDLSVVVGGLGLGYTARAVLEDPRVRDLVVVDALDELERRRAEGLDDRRACRPSAYGLDERGAALLPAEQDEVLLGREVVENRLLGDVGGARLGEGQSHGRINPSVRARGPAPARSGERSPATPGCRARSARHVRFVRSSRR